MRDWEKRAGIIAAAGVAAAALGRVLRVKALGPAGLALLGAGVFCWGLSGMLEGRMSFPRPGSRQGAIYYGLAARAWGALLCIVGAIITGAGLILLVKAEQP